MVKQCPDAAGSNCVSPSAACSAASDVWIRGATDRARAVGIMPSESLDEEFVAQPLAQSAEGMAHGRLGQAEPLPRPGCTPLGVNRIEDEQKIEIERR